MGTLSPDNAIGKVIGHINISADANPSNDSVSGNEARGDNFPYTSQQIFTSRPKNNERKDADKASAAENETLPEIQKQAPTIVTNSVFKGVIGRMFQNARTIWAMKTIANFDASSVLAPVLSPVKIRRPARSVQIAVSFITAILSFLFAYSLMIA